MKRPSLAAVLTEACRVDPDVMLTQGHLFARVRPSEDFEKGERFDVDLEESRFVHSLNKEPITLARAQLVGTFLRGEGTWMWGFANPSISASGASDILRTVEATPSLAGYAKARESFRIKEKDAELLAQYVATMAGFFAVYPAPTGRAVAYLALRLRLREDDAPSDERAMWCSSCGRSRYEVPQLAKGVGCSPLRPDRATHSAGVPTVRRGLLERVGHGARRLETRVTLTRAVNPLRSRSRLRVPQRSRFRGRAARTVW